MAQEKKPAIPNPQPEAPKQNISATLPPVGKMGNGYDLPAIGGRRGMGFQVGEFEQN